MTASCPIARGGEAVLKGVLTGDLDHNFRYETDNTASGSPDARANGETKTITTGDWLGPCAQGQAPGEGSVTMPNGVTFKVKPHR